MYPTLGWFHPCIPAFTVWCIIAITSNILLCFTSMWRSKRRLTENIMLRNLSRRLSISHGAPIERCTMWSIVPHRVWHLQKHSMCQILLMLVSWRYLSHLAINRLNLMFNFVYSVQDIIGNIFASWKLSTSLKACKPYPGMLELNSWRVVSWRSWLVNILSWSSFLARDFHCSDSLELELHHFTKQCIQISFVTESYQIGFCMSFIQHTMYHVPSPARVYRQWAQFPWTEHFFIALVF